MDRVLSEEIDENEVSREVILRPSDFSEYIGQKRVVQNIDVMVESATLRSQSMDHVLLSGPPGLGKTSLAMIIAKALGSELHVISHHMNSCVWNHIRGSLHFTLYAFCC